jgi:S-adenosylmethionine:tRNA ribosyltransferase-isomerase
VELRADHGPLGGVPSRTDRRGAVISLPGGATLTVEEGSGGRLWTGTLSVPSPLLGWLRGYGDPIRYRYVTGRWPLADYRTPFASVPGSAEMPSAGRALTPDVFAGLRASGVDVAHIVLHCGVSSLETGEPPYAEWYEVPFATAAAVSRARRVIAVGTTVVRALESSGGRPASGWTEKIITPDTRLRVVDGLLTGWHEPSASHLLMLQAVADCGLLADSYAEAGRTGYRWHEFGDLHLILP